MSAPTDRPVELFVRSVLRMKKERLQFSIVFTLDNGRMRVAKATINDVYKSKHKIFTKLMHLRQIFTTSFLNFYLFEPALHFSEKVLVSRVINNNKYKRVSEERSFLIYFKFAFIPNKERFCARFCASIFTDCIYSHARFADVVTVIFCISNFSINVTC